MMGATFGIASIFLVISGHLLMIIITIIVPSPLPPGVDIGEIMLLPGFLTGYPGFAIIALILGIIEIAAKDRDKKSRKLGIVAFMIGTAVVAYQVLSCILSVSLTLFFWYL